MLTPAKIKNHHFEASGRNSYKADSVDSFFEEVSESYEQMFRENGEMFKKINLLAERLEEYRKDEDNIQAALLMAQRMSDKITREANEKAETVLKAAADRAKSENDKSNALTIEKVQKATDRAQALINDAKIQANKILYEATYESEKAAVSAKSQMMKQQAALEKMKAEVTKFKKQIMEAYNAQYSLIEQLPEIMLNTVEEEPENIPEEKPQVKIVEAADTEVQTKEEEAPATESVAQPEIREADNMNVDHLQQMISETEDTDAEDEPAQVIDEDEYVEDTDDDLTDNLDDIGKTIMLESDEEDSAENEEDIVIPKVEEEASDEYLDKIVDNYNDTESESEPAKDVSFSKNKNGKKAQDKEGFKVNLENINSYSADQLLDEDDELDNIEDEEEDDSDDKDEGLSSKLKGFFRK